MSQVTAGTVAVTQGSATVVGTGVDWSSVPTNAVFYIDGDDRSYELTAAPVGTTLTLTTPYQGLDNPESAYSLSVDFTPVLGLARVGNQDIGTRPLLRQIVDVIDAWAGRGGGGGGGGGGGAVTKVFNRTGNVVAAIGDYTMAMITDTATYVRMLATERTKLSGIADGAQVNRLRSTTAQALAGLDDNTDMSPLTTAQAIAAVLSGGSSTEPVSAGDLTPSAILINAEVRPYNKYIQSGAITFGLDLANSNYNWGTALFDFQANGISTVTWSAEMLHGSTGLNSDLRTSWTAGIHQIAVAFDEVNGKGRVYYADAASGGGGLTGGTLTSTLTLGTGGAIQGTLWNQISKVALNGYAVTFFDMGTFAGGAMTIDISRGNVQRVVLAGNVSSITVINRPTSGMAVRLELQIHQDATGGRTVTWGPQFYFPNGGAPFVLTSAPTRFDLYTFLSWDGLSWLAETGFVNYLPATNTPTIIGTPTATVITTPGTNPITIGYTFGVGTTVLVLAVAIDHPSGIINVTWTGDNSGVQQFFTQGAFVDDSVNSSGNQAGIYWLYQPNPGNAGRHGNIVITCTNTMQLVCVPYSIAGARDPSTPQYYNGAIGNTQPSALSLTNVPDYSLLIHCAAAGNAPAVAGLGANETQDVTANNTTVFGSFSHKTLAIGGTVSVQVTFSNNTPFADVVQAFPPG